MAKVIELFDYRKADLPDLLFEIKIRQESIEKGLHQAAERFLTIEPQTDDIIRNDIVAVSLESDNPRLTSECERFRTGRGFFYPQIEDQITSHKAGDTFTCTIGSDTVTVHILSVKRRIVPALTDELVPAMGIEGVSTLADYTEYAKAQLVEEDKEKKQSALCTLVNRQVVRNSVFDLTDDEIDLEQAEMMLEFEEGTETPEELESLMLHLYHAKDLDEAKVNMRKSVEDQLKLSAAADKIAEDHSMSWSEEDYREFIKASANERMPEDELLEAIPMDNFIIQQKMEFYQNLILEYFDDRFTVEVIS